jgi:hypothetical protein
MVFGNAAEALCIELSAVVKAHTDNGKRMVWVEASNEEPDSEGDVILQSALLGSAESFLQRGHIDIDHISEIGSRMNPPIQNYRDYIVGRPVKVEDLGGGRTGVTSEIFVSSDGKSDAKNRIFDAFWESLMSGANPPWRSSIYGFPLPGEVEECSGSCPMGATRYLVKGIDWRSLAFTQHPVNDAIQGSAKIVTAKAFIKSHVLSKIAHAGSQLPDTVMAADSMGHQGGVNFSPDSNGDIGESLPAVMMSDGSRSPPIGREAMWGEYQLHLKRDCKSCADGVNVLTLRNHYMICDGMAYNDADILALAMMHLIRREQSRSNR